MYFTTSNFTSGYNPGQIKLTRPKNIRKIKCPIGYLKLQKLKVTKAPRHILKDRKSSTLFAELTNHRATRLKWLPRGRVSPSSLRSRLLFFLVVIVVVVGALDQPAVQATLSGTRKFLKMKKFVLVFENSDPRAKEILHDGQTWAIWNDASYRHWVVSLRLDLYRIKSGIVSYNSMTQ